MATASAARRDLLARLHGYRAALQDPALQHPADQLGNRDPSQLLRNGLAVVVFALLEDFLRRRTQELLSALPGHRPFNDLSKSLRSASRHGALSAALNQAGRVSDQGSDPHTFLVDLADDVASTRTARPTISPWSLGFKGSNLQSQEVLAILKALRVKGAWECLDALAHRAGAGGSSLANSFRNISKMRHKAAHEGSASIPLSDLTDATDQVATMAFAFDVVCSLAVERFLGGDDGPTEDGDVQMVFIRPDSAYGRVAENENGQVLAKAPRSSSVSHLVSQCGPHLGVAILLDRRRMPAGWYMT